MNVVDSSGWLEFFAADRNAEYFAPVVCNVPELIVPSVTLYEVFKKVHQQRGEQEALAAVGMMMKGLVIPLGETIALSAARLSLALSLPMADSIILATTRMLDAILWTQDKHFEGLEGVRYFPKSA
ncbi:MAG: type II toxin-antitoxin system VapC family toxin [Candidatus Hydrogenedentes bacterium]|nr:type II toxin-antitoxin system VapC family toxin [Candidatus Hydrogenedentota bacterium]